MTLPYSGYGRSFTDLLTDPISMIRKMGFIPRKEVICHENLPYFLCRRL